MKFKDFCDIYVDILKNKYILFHGRARRREYWSFCLINALVAIVLGVLDVVVFGADSQMQVFSSIYSLAVFLPGLGLSVRRLHDINRSGWWLLLNFIPLVGQIVLIVWACQEGTRGENDFGEDPKAVEPF